MKKKLKPLKNKSWLFTETGKTGFHYDDASNAIEGMKYDLQHNYSRLNKRELLSQLEKWFPDVIEEDVFTSQESEESTIKLEY